MMVDITEKPVSYREATAVGKIRLRGPTLNAIREGRVKKGDPLEVSKIVAIQAVKQTPQALPFCHNISITGVDVETRLVEDGVEVRVTVRSTGKTGVEMEALYAVATALLNVWDMVKYLEKDETGNYPYTEVTSVRVVKKIKM